MKTKRSQKLRRRQLNENKLTRPLRKVVIKCTPTGKKARSSKSWPRERRAIADPSARIYSVFFALCKGIGTPVALGAWLRYKHGEHAQLASMEIDAGDYTSVDRFHVDYIVVSYLKKYKGLKTGINTRQVALSAFKLAEEACQSTNDRLVSERVGVPAVESIMLMAQRKISQTLGCIDPVGNDEGLTFDDFESLCKWGPGATYSLKGDDATADKKICESKISITPSAYPILKALIKRDHLWAEARGLSVSADGPDNITASEFQFVKGCRISVVPKNAKTDRTIGIEPTGNLFLQLGVGAYIRRQLHRVGVNLDDQTRNQRLAQRAWAENLATVDLKAASDSISQQAVLQLLPSDWVELLARLRSPFYFLEGKWYEFQKWSSMGNGYTFELESLIFWALASACTDYLAAAGAVSVYGDDVILPCCAYDLFSQMLAHLGFEVNHQKSFFDGAFRESCGKHYLRAADVTPIYQKEIPSVLEEVHRLANRIGRLAYRMGAHIYLDPRLRAAHAAAVAGVEVRFATPLSSEDDDGFALPLSALSTYAHKADGALTFQLPVLVFRPKRVEAKDRALLAYKLRFGVSAELSGFVTLRRRGSFSERRRWYHVRDTADWLR